MVKALRAARMREGLSYEQVETMPVLWGEDGGKMKSFGEILKMISCACAKTYYTGDKDIKATVVECATQIYIAQMMNERVDNAVDQR